MSTLTNQPNRFSRTIENQDLTRISNLVKILVPTFTWVISVLTLTFFSVTNGGMFLNEILASSFIISCLLFVKFLGNKI